MYFVVVGTGPSCDLLRLLVLPLRMVESYAVGVEDCQVSRMTHLFLSSPYPLDRVSTYCLPIFIFVASKSCARECTYFNSFPSKSNFYHSNLLVDLVLVLVVVVSELPNSKNQIKPEGREVFSLSSTSSSQAI